MQDIMHFIIRGSLTKNGDSLRCEVAGSWSLECLIECLQFSNDFPQQLNLVLLFETQQKNYVKQGF